MEMPDIGTVTAVGGTVLGSGGALTYIVRLLFKREVSRILKAIDDLPHDLDGLGRKIRETESSMKDAFIKADTENKIALARMDERIKFQENRKS